MMQSTEFQQQQAYRKANDKSKNSSTLKNGINPETHELLDELNPIDPIKVEDEIKKEEKFLEDFKNEIDFVLSESNSLTYIEIAD